MNARKILLIRVDPRLGNVLLTTPLARALKAGLPEGELHWLVAAKLVSAIQGLPYVDRVIPFEKRDFLVRPWRAVALIRRIRAERYDVAIEASHWHAVSRTHLALARLSGAPMRIGHDRGSARRFLTHAVPHHAEAVSDVDAKLELLSPLGLGAAGKQLETPLGSSTEDREEVQRALAAAGVAEARWVALNPGGRKADHRWSPEGFGAVARKLADRDLVPVVFWGPGEEDIARAVIRASGGRAHLGPPTDVRQLAAAFRSSRAVVTNDTGPMHLAAAVGAPTIAVMLTADSDRWVHGQPGFVAVKAGPIESTAERIAAEVVAAAGAGPR